MRRRSYLDARCLVTGASMGLGRAIAERLVRRGARVALAARSADKLDEVARGLIADGAARDAVLPVVADLTDAEDRDRLFATIRERFGALDLVVNSAGVGMYGRFESHTEDDLRRIMEINFFALVEVTRAALPLLRLGQNPGLVNIGSIIARRALPGRSEYSASKHAVAAFTEAIRAEWATDGIQVLLLNPGFTATNFEQNVIVDTAIYKTQNRRTMSADDVARAMLRALRNGKNEVTLSGPGRILLMVNRLFPRFVDWGLGRWTRRLYANVAELERVERRGPREDPAAIVPTRNGG